MNSASHQKRISEKLRILGLCLIAILGTVPACGEKKGFVNEETSLETRLQSAGLPLGAPVFIRAFKEEKTLELFLQSPQTNRFELFASYPIAAASGRLGPKHREGDRQVPEGFYYVPPSAMNPNSRYHLSFNIGYPNDYDLAHGRTGSYIMVHGSNVSIGCLAMTDEKIEEIYKLCEAAHQAGQPLFRIHIFPFRMTQRRLDLAKGEAWHSFWKNLKQGYDLFEENKVPPNTKVSQKQYTFE